MTLEQLSKFCDADHHKMFKPFTFGNYSYASNGHLLVRVPRVKECEAWESLNERAAAMFDSLDMPTILDALIEIPDFQQPESENCTVCKGSGKITKCPECDGSGYVEFENDYNEYEVYCKNCNGHGSIIGEESVCESCDGTGKKKIMKRIDVGCTGFSHIYLNMLKALPGMKIAPIEPTQANYFKWDEGDGLIMPMRD